MKRTALAALVLPFLALPGTAHAGGGCHLGGPAAETAVGAAYEVKIDHTCFGPVALAVRSGTQVVWRNLSELQHNVSGPGVEYTDLAPGEVFRKSFDDPGYYPYACTIHAGMSGVVHVVDPEATGAAAAGAPHDGGSGGEVAWAAGGLALLAALGAGGVTLARRARRGEPVPA